MAALYELTNDFLQLDDLIDHIDNEEDKKAAEEIKAIVKKAIEEKSNSIAFYIKNLEADIEARKLEEKRLRENRQTMEKKLANFKQYVIENLILINQKSINTDIGKVSIRTSKAVEVSCDINTLPDNYKRTKTIVEADKTALKKALNDGEQIEGVEIIENYNLNIK